MKTKVALLNCVKSGGLTYLNYIKSIIDMAPKNWKITVFQHDFSNITINESKKFLKRDVVKLEKYNQLFTFPIVISNDAYIGRFLKNPRTILIDHGNCPMPCPDDTYYASWTAFWDFVITPSMSGLKVTGEGHSYYIRNRHFGNIKPQQLSTNGQVLNFSNDLRKTSLCQIPPLRKIIKHKTSDISELKSNITIGFLPTANSAVHPDLSIYSYLSELIETIISEFPDSEIIFRPYPDDLHHPNMPLVENYLNKFNNILIEKKGISSKDFFNKCDVLISDASTGGISFLLDKCIPPIYWKPIDTKSHSKPTNSFYELLEDKILVAENPEQLIRHIYKCKKMNNNERVEYFNRYCNDELKIDNNLTSILETLDINSSFDINKFPNVDSKGSFELSI